ncbi:N-acetylmuramoyl-L-alanine amidase [Pseudomonas sp. 21LCFQ02]|uniref:N-acetylmuramoyl-L-alanine amidase n=1 Tax=unclassified Pseudomonas TaxID=196821 RepID=UPI0004F6250B|nr:MULTISPECIES: N-acetylmuramoyl-L-alanine amidase [unclassified Pseudomonas]MCO8169409.1 N-acetylmuramoyl-L-alanine amidase [Pseudomonas sp. 21LCFQ02]MCQ9422946.1 N-acetylmuramoyl-L-alanine amidase [Pseudomonas sp. LJDD11]BAP45238.1 cell wall hydrolase/autolysin [Pseudomonas sp. StFLB209]
MQRRHLLQLLLASITLPLSLSAQASQQLLAARVESGLDSLRLAFELSGPSRYRTFSLQAPQRLIIDLEQTQLATRLDDLPLPNTLLKAIRSGAQGQGMRLVLDLQDAVELHSITLQPGPGNRQSLQLELRSLAVPGLKQPAMAGKSVSRDIVVVIDPGHGGKDPGALGPKGEQEKQVALAIARLLAQKLNRQAGFKAHLVRNDDVFIPLRKRVEVARKRNADMFISVHADAAPRKTASGASVFALSQNGATSTTARWLADRENQADLIGARDLLSLKDKDPMLAGVILDMSLTSTITSSLSLGKTILDNVGQVAGTHQKRVEQAGFAVLKSPDIPSILVETGFISNPNDCRQLCDPRHQNRVAQAIYEGIQQHFKNNRLA